MSENVQYEVLFVGEENVGKSCIFLYDKPGEFYDHEEKTIISIPRCIEIEKNNWKNLHVTDIPGKDFSEISNNSILKGQSLTKFDGCFATYDITNRESFINLWKWLKLVLEKYGDIPIILIGNKSDLADQRQVSKKEGEKLANALGAKFIETSVQTGDKVKEIFKIMVKTIIGNASSGEFKKVSDEKLKNIENVFSEMREKETKKSKKASRGAKSKGTGNIKIDSLGMEKKKGSQNGNFFGKDLTQKRRYCKCLIF